MAMALLHFVSEPSQVISEIKRVLRPGGMFITNGPQERLPSDDMVSEITGKGRRYYREMLEGRGIQESGQLGWTSRQIRENLPSFFRNCGVVESDGLVFRYTSTPGWFLKRLGSRFTAFQVNIDQEIHEEVMQDIRSRLISEYGDEFEEMEQEYCGTHRLTVCSM